MIVIAHSTYEVPHNVEHENRTPTITIIRILKTSKVLWLTLKNGHLKHLSSYFFFLVLVFSLPCSTSKRISNNHKNDLLLNQVIMCRLPVASYETCVTDNILAPYIRSHIQTCIHNYTHIAETPWRIIVLAISVINLSNRPWCEMNKNQ